MSNWWKKENTIPYDDPHFIEILKFYLHECPVIYKNGKRVASRGDDFKSKGWDQKMLTKLIDAMKKNKGKPITYHCCKTNENVEDIMRQIEKSNSTTFEAIVYLENPDLYKTQSIFYCIRNALAHSSFSVTGSGNNKMYFFESQKNNIIKGQIRIKESTLLYWIKLFNSPRKFQKKKTTKIKNMKKHKAA